MTNTSKRIESSAEITALLKYFMELVGADAAILYKFIDTDDLEAAELLELLARSPLNKQLTNLKINNSTIGLLIDKYKDGSIDFLIESKSILSLKKNIRVLRFCDFTERDGSPSRWKFDYANRPRKYLVVNDDLLGTIKNEEAPPTISKDDLEAYTYQLQDEGVTALFCRSNGDEKKFIGKTTFQKTEIITQAPSELTEEKYVAGDSQTFRYMPHMVLSRDELNKQVSHTKTTKEDGVFDNFHSHHAAFVLLQETKETKSQTKSKNETVGCLRFEFYDKGDSFESKIADIKSKLETVADNNMIRLVVGIVNKVLSNLKGKSYENQYHCLMPIVDLIEKVGVKLRKNRCVVVKDIVSKYNLNDDEIAKLQYDLKIANYQAIKDYKSPYNNEDMQRLYNAMKMLEIQGLIEHLFYVLKRNTYYGEAILERINRFIIDLLKTLELPQKIFSEIWDSLKKHEDLMLYDIDNYRDHLMHQFHVFVVGYLFICSYGIEQFKSLVQCSYDKAMNRKALHDKSSAHNSLAFFSDIDIVRIWTLTSLFHDCGYAFEKLSAGFDSFSQRVLGAKLETEFKLDKVFFENSTMIGSFETMTCYFSCCNTISSNFDRVRLFRILSDNLLRRFDHGVISALILLEKFKEKSEITNIEDIKYMAALAIAIHNQPVFEKLHEVCNQSICLQSNPMAYLLGYCDTIQEWGRKKTTKDNHQKATPHLKQLRFPSSNNQQQENRPLIYEVELVYPSISDGNKPDGEVIKKILSKKQCVFVTSCDHLFSIKYDIRSCYPEGFTVDFMPCGHQCQFLCSHSAGVAHNGKTNEDIRQSKVSTSALDTDRG